MSSSATPHNLGDRMLADLSMLSLRAACVAWDFCDCEGCPTLSPLVLMLTSASLGCTSVRRNVPVVQLFWCCFLETAHDLKCMFKNGHLSMNTMSMNTQCTHSYSQVRCRTRNTKGIYFIDPVQSLELRPLPKCAQHIIARTARNLKTLSTVHVCTRTCCSSNRVPSRSRSSF